MALLWFLTLAGLALAAEPYIKTDYMIPMRDGVKLHTEVWRPPADSPSEPLPFLIQRSPYGWGRAKTVLETSLVDLANERYLFVFQDIRGRYQSGGEFIMSRPLRDKTNPNSIDEGTDTYDTIEWLLKNVPGNNGRAGIFGISYGGWLTAMALLEPHPALKAASEQASPSDMFLGDDFHHNGAFRLSYGFEYASMMENGKENAPFKFDKYDTYQWYLDLGPLREANRRYLDGARPTWNNFVTHPDYDPFWRQQEVSHYMKNIKVPNLNVSGWFDQEDFYGPWKIYREAEKTDSGGLNSIVIGPWNHGGWSRGDGRILGKIDFGSDTAKYFREQVQAPWFAYWLKDKGKLDEPEVLSFETGSNEWHRYQSWPPKNVQSKNLYFKAGGLLSFDAPGDSADKFDEFVSDPARPVPYRNRPIPPTFTAQGWSTWLLDDQRFADCRPDVLVWQTDVLKEDVTITGDVAARLFASTSESDADWIVKLIDVLPDAPDLKPPELSGYELMIAADVLRGRFRDGFDHPKPMTPGEPAAFRLDLLAHDHCFKKGHRIMVQLQSSWFPVIDRNPQKFVVNIFEAAPADFKRATHRVYRTADMPSHLVLPVAVN
jgi:putative CocE/NonD family hydrolase